LGPRKTLEEPPEAVEDSQSPGMASPQLPSWISTTFMLGILVIESKKANPVVRRRKDFSL
jgi:hypothetical protein